MWFLLGIFGSYVASLLCGLPIAWPYDVCVNAGDVEIQAELRAPADGKRRVVVLQHGIWRSSWALARLARALQLHGYEVHNLDYPSTKATIEDHAERLARALAAIDATGRVDEWSFVGHSMGGLVIQECLRQRAAWPVANCVYIATPHRGATLAERRQHWFLFRLAMGTAAALQLSPGHAIHERPIPMRGRCGTIVGNIGAGNATIPGDDDGTVAVAEATFDGATASVEVPFGHTRIVSQPETIVQVLTFLHTGAFAKTPAVR